MIEDVLLQYAFNNGSGVLFGILMYRLATNAIAKQTKAIEALSEKILSLKKS